jgi:hypothetical protein
MADRKDVQRARAANTSRLLNLPNVIGVGDGFRVTGGQRTDEVCVVVLVRRKVPRAGLKEQDVVPKRIEGVRTDVLEVGELRALPSRTDRVRPALPGLSIGHYQVTAGTFGAVVRSKENGDRLILSNNHVLANSNAAAQGDPILQPGAADGGEVDGDTLAQLRAFIPIQFLIEPADCGIASGLADIANLIARLLGSRHRLQAYQTQPDAVNSVDAALARPLADVDIGPAVVEIGALTGTTEALLGMRVRKSGRTTGLTSGEIVVVEATVTVGYGPSRRAKFQGQIVTTAMSGPGDSGSMLVAEESSEAVGLLFAGSDQVSLHNPIEGVLQALDADLP